LVGQQHRLNHRVNEGCPPPSGAAERPVTPRRGPPPCLSPGPPCRNRPVRGNALWAPSPALQGKKDSTIRLEYSPVFFSQFPFFGSAKQPLVASVITPAVMQLPCRPPSPLRHRPHPSQKSPLSCGRNAAEPVISRITWKESQSPWEFWEYLWFPVESPPPWFSKKSALWAVK